MDVAPHPHTYLAPCTWLFSGRVRHDDSAGHHLDVVPGDTVLMVAGQGIAHSEYSWPDGPDLHGVQLGSLSDRRARERGLHHFTTSEVAHGVTAVFLGELRARSGDRFARRRSGAGAMAEEARPGLAHSCTAVRSPPVAHGAGACDSAAGREVGILVDRFLVAVGSGSVPALILA